MKMRLNINYSLYLLALLLVSISAYGQSKGDGISTIEIPVGELIFQAMVSGNKSNEPAVIFLHGFPETAYMWKETIRAVEKAGYYCLAPDQRGYSATARPKKKSEYRLEKLAQDVIDMADAQGLEKFHLVGHDWGSAVGWALAATYPERILSWTAMSVPHIRAFGQAIQTDKDQAKKSAYINAFQRRGIAEWILKRKKLKLLREQLWNTSPPDQLDNYVQIFQQKGAIKAALNWYRANYKEMKKDYRLIPIEDIHVPTLLIWGKNDEAINRTSVDLTEAYMKGDYQLEVLDAGHWLTQEAGPRVIELIISHLEKY